MRHWIGMLYLATALVGLAWAWYKHALLMYGAPWGWWNIALYAGSLTLLLGATVWWGSGTTWTQWLPLIGSAMLASFFLPAFIRDLHELRSTLAVIAREPIEALISVGSVALVLASLLIAITVRIRTVRP